MTFVCLKGIAFHPARSPYRTILQETSHRTRGKPMRPAEGTVLGLDRDCEDLSRKAQRLSTAGAAVNVKLNK
jgi:hypothetical protein